MSGWVTAAQLIGRTSLGASRATTAALAQLHAGRGARRGFLAPGDPFPYGYAGGWLDYRGAADARRLRGLDGPFELGRLYDLRRGKAVRPVGLEPHDVFQHAFVAGPTGAGKTTGLIVPWVLAALRCGMSVVCVDVKGDMLERVERAAGQRPAGTAVRATTWDFRHARSASWRWTAETAGDRAASAAAEALLGRQRPADPQPFFWQRDMRILTALLRCAARAGADARHLAHACQSQQDLGSLACWGDADTDAALADAMYADPADFPRVMSGTVNAIQPLATEPLLRITQRPELDLEDVLSAPGLLCVGAPVGDGRLGQAASALLLRMLAAEVYRRAGQAGHPVLFVIDEAPRVADRIDLEELLSLGRSSGTAVLLAVQDIDQLEERSRGPILANCQTMAVLAGAGPRSAKALSARFGHRPAEEIAVDRRPGAAGHLSHRVATAPVIGEREIMHPPLPGRPAIVHAASLGSLPLVCDLQRPA